MALAGNRDALRRSLLRIVEYNTGDSQPKRVSDHVIVQIKARSKYDPSVVREALATLVKDGALERESPGLDAAPRYRRPSNDERS